jgi:hypothetical protein
MAVLGVARESVRTFAQIVRLNRQRARADRSGAAALSAAAASGAARPFAYDEALGVLAARGVPEFHVREGSMPEASLRFCADVVRRELAGLGRPVRGCTSATSSASRWPASPTRCAPWTPSR